jgi:hypothetical protein
MRMVTNMLRFPLTFPPSPFQNGALSKGDVQTPLWAVVLFAATVARVL